MDVAKGWMDLASSVGGLAGPVGNRPNASGQHLTVLLGFFLSWKLVLLSFAVCGPGQGYDTSTSIVLEQSHRIQPRSWIAKLAERLVLRLVRWDAIYYTSASVSGQVYEQEWAFRSLFSKLTRGVQRVFFFALPSSPFVKHALAGIFVSLISHLCAVVVLYRLVYDLAPSTQEAKKRRLAFTTACLHVISPAGIFLLAPYSEATFALANFLGMLCYVKAVHNRHQPGINAHQFDAFWTIMAGVCFGLATMVRSNGILSGLIFLWDLFSIFRHMSQIFCMHSKKDVSRLLATVIGGLCVAFGFAFPQVMAYMEYCTAGNSRPWCSKVPPSIYTFVQDYYWDVGFLRYWKLSNLPLFVLAFPVGWLMAETSIPSLFQVHHINRVINGLTSADQRLQPYPPVPDTQEERVFEYVLPRFALPQLVLVALAATSFHCQIINRLSSGYPLWYFILAVELCLGDWDDKAKNRAQGLFRLFGNYDRIPSTRPEWVVRGMVIYAIVQTGLYASFLPPA